MAGTRDPTSHRTPEQMRKMDRGYNARPENIKKRAMNNKARKIMKKAGADIAGKDVHHKRAIRHGGGNGGGNLAVSSVHRNRGWEREE